MSRPRVPMESRLWSKVNKTADCWLWRGSLGTNGYGRFWDGVSYSEKGQPRSGMAHRAVYELLVGPIPEGFQLDHLCRNTRCVNPDHLEAVTPRVNVLRSTAFTAQNAAKTECPFGHPLEGDNLYVYDGHRSCRVCRREADQRHDAKDSTGTRKATHAME